MLPKNKKRKIMYCPQKHEEGTPEAVRFAKSITPGENVNEDVSMGQLRDLEKFADRLLSTFKIDIEFTRHFIDRVNDDRNRPKISIPELQKLFIKIAKEHGARIKRNANSEAVINDMQTDLNLPVVIKYHKNKNEFEVINKTIMRKKDFKTSSPKIRYENKSFFEFREAVDTADKKVEYYVDKNGKKRIKLIPTKIGIVKEAVKAKQKPKQKFAVGDTVVPNIGPHNGDPHRVIHVHDDGSYNIQPIGSVNRYRTGAVRADHNQLKKGVKNNGKK